MGEAQFEEKCQMGTQNIIKSEVSSPDEANFKPETSIQVMNTISDVTKAGQLITKIYVFHLIVHFGTMISTIIKCYTAVRLKTVLSTLGPLYVLKL